MTDKPASGLHFEVEGFKSFREPISMAFGPLTILSGANSSGKSSALQPLLLLKQTLESPYDPGPLLIDGPNASFYETREMLWQGRTRTDHASSFIVSITDDHRGTTERLCFSESSDGFELAWAEHKPADGPQVRLHPRLSARRLQGVAKKPFETLNFAASWKPTIVRNRCSYEIRFKSPDSSSGGFAVGFTPTADLRATATRLIHLPGLRDNPSRFYPATEVGEVFPGVFQPYTASLIAAWQQSRSPQLDKLNLQLRSMALTWKIHAQRLGATRVALKVGRLNAAVAAGGHDMVNIADVGLGLSQALPVLVALLAARPGQLVYLEQPELHLHPRAQASLAEPLLAAARRGVRVVAETHSNILIRSIQTKVAREDLPSDFVQLHWFSRDVDGATQINTAALNERGLAVDWPADFSDVELDVEEAFLIASADRYHE